MSVAFFFPLYFPAMSKKEVVQSNKTMTARSVPKESVSYKFGLEIEG